MLFYQKLSILRILRLSNQIITYDSIHGRLFRLISYDVKFKNLIIPAIHSKNPNDFLETLQRLNTENMQDVGIPNLVSVGIILYNTRKRFVSILDYPHVLNSMSKLLNATKSIHNHDKYNDSNHSNHQLSSKIASDTMKLDGKTLGKIFYGISKITGKTKEEKNLILGISNLIQSLTALKVNHRFLEREVSSVFSGLQNLDTSIPEVQDLLNSIYKFVYNLKFHWSGKDIGSICYGIQKFSAKTDIEKKLIRYLAESFHEVSKSGTHIVMTDQDIILTVHGLQHFSGALFMEERAFIQSLNSIFSQQKSVVFTTGKSIGVLCFSLYNLNPYLNGSISDSKKNLVSEEVLELYGIVSNWIDRSLMLDSSLKLYPSDISFLLYGLKSIYGFHSTELQYISSIEQCLKRSLQAMDGHYLSRCISGLQSIATTSNVINKLYDTLSDYIAISTSTATTKTITTTRSNILTIRHLADIFLGIRNIPMNITESGRNLLNIIAVYLSKSTIVSELSYQPTTVVTSLFQLSIICLNLRYFKPGTILEERLILDELTLFLQKITKFDLFHRTDDGHSISNVYCKDMIWKNSSYSLEELLSNAISNIFYGMQSMTGETSSEQNYFQEITRLLEMLHSYLLSYNINISFHSIQISNACYSFRFKSIESESEQKLLTILVSYFRKYNNQLQSIDIKSRSNSKFVWNSVEFGRICCSIRNMTGKTLEEQKYITELTTCLQIYQNYLVNHNNRLLLDGKSISLACSGIKKLDLNIFVCQSYLNLLSEFLITSIKSMVSSIPSENLSYSLKLSSDELTDICMSLQSITTKTTAEVSYLNAIVSILSQSNLSSTSILQSVTVRRVFLGLQFVDVSHTVYVQIIDSLLLLLRNHRVILSKHDIGNCCYSLQSMNASHKSTRQVISMLTGWIADSIEYHANRTIESNHQDGNNDDNMNDSYFYEEENLFPLNEYDITRICYGLKSFTYTNEEERLLLRVLLPLFRQSLPKLKAFVPFNNDSIPTSNSTERSILYLDGKTLSIACSSILNKTMNCDETNELLEFVSYWIESYLSYSKSIYANSLRKSIQLSNTEVAMIFYSFKNLDNGTYIGNPSNYDDSSNYDNGNDYSQNKNENSLNDVSSLISINNSFLLRYLNSISQLVIHSLSSTLQASHFNECDGKLLAMACYGIHNFKVEHRYSLKSTITIDAITEWILHNSKIVPTNKALAEKYEEEKEDEKWIENNDNESRKNGIYFYLTAKYPVKLSSEDLGNIGYSFRYFNGEFNEEVRYVKSLLPHIVYSYPAVLSIQNICMICRGMDNFTYSSDPIIRYYKYIVSKYIMHTIEYLKSQNHENHENHEYYTDYRHDVNNNIDKNFHNNISGLQFSILCYSMKGLNFLIGNSDSSNHHDGDREMLSALVEYLYYMISDKNVHFHDQSGSNELNLIVNKSFHLSEKDIGKILSGLRNFHGYLLSNDSYQEIKLLTLLCYVIENNCDNSDGNITNAKTMSYQTIFKSIEGIKGLLTLPTLRNQNIFVMDEITDYDENKNSYSIESAILRLLDTFGYKILQSENLDSICQNITDSDYRFLMDMMEYMKQSRILKNMRGNWKTNETDRPCYLIIAIERILSILEKNTNERMNELQTSVI